jgi:hypothetical protein
MYAPLEHSLHYNSITSTTIYLHKKRRKQKRCHHLMTTIVRALQIKNMILKVLVFSIDNENPHGYASNNNTA